MATEQNLFTDSDTDYENVDVSGEKYKASSNISNRPRKFGGSKIFDGKNVIMKRSPKKSPKTLKQLITRSPKKIAKSAGLSELKANEMRRDPSATPYYLVNFECILRGVIDETDDRELFDAGELEVVEKFRSLDAGAKKLYVRLFQRKHNWIQRTAISYEEIESVDESCSILAGQKFVARAEDELDSDLETVLNLVSAPNIKKLCKDLRIFGKGTKKEDFVSALMKHSRQKSFFMPKKSMSSVIMAKAKPLLGDCYRLLDGPRSLFTRIFSLYSLSNWWDERESERGQQQGSPQMTAVLLQNTGRLVFPSFSIIRKRRIFRDRADLVQFEQMCMAEADVADAVGNKDWDLAAGRVKEAARLFDAVLADDSLSEHAASLPTHLRKFTSGSVLAYALTKGAEVYERLKRYDEAVGLLEKLLGQSLYLPDYHGHWFERLSLDLDQHLKRPADALDAIRRGLDDPHVQEARLLALSLRATKISSKLKAGDDLSGHPRFLRAAKLPEERIQGKLMPKPDLPGAKTVFVMEENEESLLCSVEEFVREHYKRHEGYPNGVHGEGAVVNTIAAILFWDIIFDLDIPDAFRNPHQAAPLDFNSPEFYEQRKLEIDERLENLAGWDPDSIADFARSRWEMSSGVTSCPASWDLFANSGDFLGLLRCFSGPQLAGICGRLMRNHRHTRSGFPDLTVWDTAKNRIKFVEVKGPNDRLSNKQILWIEFLNRIGVDSTVCYVEAANSMMGRTSRKLSPNKKPAKTSSPARKKARRRTRRNSEDDFDLR